MFWTTGGLAQEAATGRSGQTAGQQGPGCPRITGLAERLEAMGMRFGLWFEPEMTNKDSDFLRAHPDWILATPERSQVSWQISAMCWIFSRKEVVDAIYEQMRAILRATRNFLYQMGYETAALQRCYSAAGPADGRERSTHRYILGV